jgi:hypothetical protein
MFPTTFTDKTECLQGLVGIRTGCAVDKQYPFWIEDIEGVDMKKIAKMAKSSNPTGKDFANQLINNAARQMLGDLELLLNNGYKMNNIVGDMCSACTLLPNYTVNAGIMVKNSIASRFSTMKITRLNVLTNFTGEKQITIDDGVEPQYFTVDLIAGQLMPIKLDYSTTEKEAKVFFTDPTVPVGQVSCATSTSCGCGGSQTSQNPVTISGLLAGIKTTTQYGFLPCVAIGCSYDSLVCNLITQTPNIFGLTMLYKVGELYYDNRNVSDRNSESIAFNEEEGTEQKKNYARLYWAKMKGTSGMAGVNTLISQYLKDNRADRCVVCDSKIKTAYATG